MLKTINNFHFEIEIRDDENNFEFVRITPKYGFADLFQDEVKDLIVDLVETYKSLAGERATNRVLDNLRT